MSTPSPGIDYTIYFLFLCFFSNCIIAVPEPSDPVPQGLNIGAINPYALVQALTGKKFDWSKPESTKILSDVLETDYAELFDMKFNSPLYAGLKLNPTTQAAEPLKASEIKVLMSNDRLTPALNMIKKLADLRGVGGGDNLDSMAVQEASVYNGKMTLVLPAPAALSKKITNTDVTKPMFDLVIPKEGPAPAAGFTPPGTTWKDMGNFFNQQGSEFNDPIQGAVGNCYLIAALAAVAWADPYRIIQRTRATSGTDHTNAIQFYSKNHRHNGPTKLVEVTDKTLVDRWNRPVYCSSFDSGEIWPAVYEKAYAKWTTNDTTDMPDILKTRGGDPVAAVAQITNETPYYYATNARTAAAIFTIVRANSVSYKTIHPMVAWTYAASDPDIKYIGPNIAANHAYTILGWATRSGQSYIVLRNPWGKVEPSGLNTFQGVVSFLDGTFWRPINTIASDGIFALEVNSFKRYFAGLGVAR
jgi:hypothetical protein